MTAFEARQLGAGANLEKYSSLYEDIDYKIEEAAKNGEIEVDIEINGRNDSWKEVFEKRDHVQKHYESLGYVVDCYGYNRATCHDELTIRWA